jgi:hypothetical protein
MDPSACHVIIFTRLSFHRVATKLSTEIMPGLAFKVSVVYFSVYFLCRAEQEEKKAADFFYNNSQRGAEILCLGNTLSITDYCFNELSNFSRQLHNKETLRKSTFVIMSCTAIKDAAL